MRFSLCGVSGLWRIAPPEASSDMAGAWVIKFQDPYAHYVFDAVIKPADGQFWPVVKTLRETEHPFHRTRIGQSDTDCRIRFEGDKAAMICDGTDPNPSTQGRYHQEYEGTFGEDGVLHGQGRHQGVLNSSVSWEMRRKE